MRDAKPSIPDRINRIGSNRQDVTDCMHLTNKGRNVLRGLKQRWGTGEMKRSLWNKAFAAVRWANLENTAGDVIYQYLFKYCKNSSLLDLGCGSGNTGCELSDSAYHDYTGVDISDVAIEIARKRSNASGRERKNRYHHGDITTYTPDRTYDVILFRESIPYIPKMAIRHQLERYARYLKENGVFIIRWYHQAQGQALLSGAMSEYKVLEHRPEGGEPFIVVMQPCK